MIELTETQIEQIREHTKHRADIRAKLAHLRGARHKFKHVSLTFKGEHDTSVLEMRQGPRGGLMGDMLDALETHLNEQDASLTQQLADLGVKVA